MAKRKHKKNKKKSIFGIAMVIYISILSAIFLSILIVIWGKLSSYQDSQNDVVIEKAKKDDAKKAPQIAFTNYLSEMTFDDWYEIYKENSSDLNKDEDIKEFIENKLMIDSLEKYRSYDYTDEAPSYLVRYNDEDLAFFKLSKNGENWLVTPSLNINADISDSITIPDGANLLCNNNLIDAASDSENILIEAVSMDTASVPDYEDRLVNPVQYKKYTISGLISQPDFTITADNNNIALDKNGCYYITLADGNEYKNRASDFINSLLHYYAAGKASASSNMATAASYVVSGSTASSVIRQSLDGVMWRPASNTSYDTSASEVYILADNCYCVDISYKEHNNTSDSDSISENSPSEATDIYRVYFLDLGNGFGIYNFALQ